MTKKSAIISIIVLAVVVLAAWFLFNRLSGNAPQARPSAAVSTATTTAAQSQNPSAVVKTQIDDSKLPPNFPSDVPLETGADITQNFTEVIGQGVSGSSRGFVSSKSMAANFSLYQTALKNSGWTIAQATDDTVNKRFIIFASKGSNYLSIFITTNAKGQVIVTIYNIIKPQ